MGQKVACQSNSACNITAFAMRQLASNLLTALSLMLFIATSVLWIRCGQYTWDTFSWQRPGGIAYTTVSVHGSLMFMRATLSDRNAPIGLRYCTDNNTALGEQDNSTLASRLGLRITPTSVPRQWHNGTGSERVPARCVYFPYWLLTIVFAAAPVSRAISHLRARRRKLPGFCRCCGYDIRATPTRCPECGTAATA